MMHNRKMARGGSGQNPALSKMIDSEMLSKDQWRKTEAASAEEILKIGRVEYALAVEVKAKSENKNGTQCTGVGNAANVRRYEKAQEQSV